MASRRLWKMAAGNIIGAQFRQKKKILDQCDTLAFRRSQTWKLSFGSTLNLNWKFWLSVNYRDTQSLYAIKDVSNISMPRWILFFHISFPTLGLENSSQQWTAINAREWLTNIAVRHGVFACILWWNSSCRKLSVEILITSSCVKQLRFPIPLFQIHESAFAAFYRSK